MTNLTASFLFFGIRLGLGLSTYETRDSTREKTTIAYILLDACLSTRTRTGTGEGSAHIL